MSNPTDRHLAAADEIAGWLAANGQQRRAKTIRSIRMGLQRVRDAHRLTREDLDRLRRKLTPIAQARASEARATLNAELVATAELIDRMAKIADTGGAGPVGIEVPDAAYLSSLLRRAVL